MYKLNKIIPIAILTIASLALAQPNLITPTNGSWVYSQIPFFDWTDVSGASNYRLQVDYNPTFPSPIIDAASLLSSEYQTPEFNPIPESLYYWRVWDDFSIQWSEVWSFRVELKGPDPIAPTPDAVINDPTPTFIWYLLPGALKYRLIVIPNGSVTPVIDDSTLTDTTFTQLTGLAENTYNWQTQAKDSFGHWSSLSDAWAFTLDILPAGWAQKESMPSPGAPKKYVKDGASMVGVSLATKDGENALYAFRGSKSKELWQYVTAWVQKESLLYGVKPDKPTKINKKAVGKGASLCYDGANIIYATKGNGTTEFWAYYILEDSWAAKAFVPVPKTLKGGTSIAYYDGKVYLLAGGHKPTDPTNFYGYDVTSNTWNSLLGVNLGPTYKPWKDGSCLTELEGTIYALKGGGKANLFFAYDIAGNTWTPAESIPIMDSIFGKYKKVLVKDGGTMTSGDGVIYAVKGGGANVFWKYTNAGGWIRLESIPRLHKKSVPKTGAALAYANEKIYLLKGNNTPEFWAYTPAATGLARVNPTRNIPLMANTTPIAKHNNNLTVNTFSNTIRYTVPVASKVTIKLYNAIGRLVETMHNGYLNAGTYTMNISRIASGVYFLQYEHNTTREEIKLIVQ